MKANRTIGAAVVLSVLLMAAPARGTTTWDGGGADGLWDTPANWNPDGVPAPGGDEVKIDNGAQITSIGTHSFPGVVRVGYGAVNGLVNVTQTAGTASGAAQFTMGPTSTYDLQGGTFTQTGTSTYDGLYIGFDGGDLAGAHGTFIVSGGTLAAQRLYIIRQRYGELRVVGGLGAINIGDLEPRESSAGLIALQPNANALSPINVAGGADIIGLSLSVGFIADPTPGHVFTVINKTSPGPVTGTFTGLAQGDTLSVPRVVGGGSWDLKVSYAGGDGNDVTLTVASAGIANMTASPAGPLDLGPLGVSTASTVTTVTLSSNGDPGTTVKITDASVAGAGFGFSSTPGATPVSVLAGANAQYGIQLAAQTVPGHYTGTATFVTDIAEGAGFKTFTYDLSADVIAHAGDVNGDGQVSLLDYNIIKANFGNSYESGNHWNDGDVNGDQQVGLLDFNIVKAHFGHTTGDGAAVTAVPEPATLSLLALAGLAALRRRR
ncbi:MAG: dockerin type I repeat-containing protein [Planctomycetota bacterium]|nr:dockerin type I repeat-containing protein [Planctomycetota bacterium]